MIWHDNGALKLINICPGLDIPFLLLPFRPTSDPSAARNFIRNFFDRGIYGEALAQELRLTEPMVCYLHILTEQNTHYRNQVLCSVVKWCWSRLPGGVVSWDAYELFKVGESGMWAHYGIGFGANYNVRLEHGQGLVCYLHTAEC